MTVSLLELENAQRDPVVFASELLRQPLWKHQVEVVRSPARYRVLCAGRRSGKTRTYGVLALHTAFSRPRAKVLIVSASDTSAMRMFADLRAMVADAPLLRGSMVDETQHLLTLDNGSTVECVPSSMKAVRAAEADLLICDEAGFIDEEIWQAAEPVIGARPGARVLIGSTPWRGPGHFFHDLWRQGMSRPDAEVQSWHWPSTVSPLVDRKWLKAVRERNPEDYYRREYLAEWTDDSGAFFAEKEITDNVASYQLLSPADAFEQSGGHRQLPAIIGIDWGQARDANAMVLLSPLEDQGRNDELLGGGGRRVPLYVPYLEARYRWPWSDFIQRIVETAASYRVQMIASETNGVGAYPTDDLRSRVHKRVGGGVRVAPVWTDVRRKQSGFGKLKSMLQHHQLILPNHPELLKQLRALEFEQTQSGSMKIAVPERAGHDDLAMALMQAISCVGPERIYSRGHYVPSLARRREPEELVQTPAGLKVPARPLPAMDVGSFVFFPQGMEKSEGW